MTRDVVEELYGNHINVLTSGNHIRDKREIIVNLLVTMKLFSDRPIFLHGSPGWGSVVRPDSSGDILRSD